MSAVVAGYIDKLGSGTIEREFVRANNGTQIAVDRILWVKWDDDIGMFLVRLGDEGITTHRVSDEQMARVGFTR